MSLYKRGNVWWCYWHRDGIRYQYSARTSNKRQAGEIEQKLKEIQNAEYFNLTSAFQPQMSFSDLVNNFLAKANAVPKPSHLSRAKPLLRYFGQMSLARITKSAAQEYRVHRQIEREQSAKRKLTEATINRDLGCLRRMLNWAVDVGILALNPLMRLRLEPE